MTRRAGLAAALVALGALAVMGGCSREPAKAPQEVLPAERPAPPVVPPPVDEEASIGPAIGGVRLGGQVPLPDLKLLSVGDKEVSLSEVQGKKGLLVVFTCNTCPYARAWEQRIVLLGNEYLGHGIGVIAVNANDPSANPGESFEAMKTRAKERGLEYPYVVDATSQLARAFGATRTPEAFVFGADGKLVYHGTIDDNAQAPNQVTEQYLKNALAAVVSGQPVPVPETKSLGCSIKFRT